MDTLALEKKLIELVRTFPCLWQISTLGYRDMKMKENAWKELQVQVRVHYVILIFLYTKFMMGKQA